MSLIKKRSVARVGPAKMIADFSTPFGLHLYRYGLWDDTLAILGKLLKHGDTFVDCGAHQGLFTVVAAAIVGSAGSVIAFEPVPSSAAMLVENVRLNGFENVQVIKCALADTEGTRQFFISGGAAGTSSFVLGEGTEIIVDTTTLDRAIGDLPVRLVKVDVEGAELAVLRGADKLLASDADWIIEIEPSNLARQGTRTEDLVDVLTSSGRRCTPLAAPNYLFFRPSG
jgi:FkbM family methyltransferase